MQKGFAKVLAVLAVAAAAATAIYFLRPRPAPLGEFVQSYAISATQPGTNFICGPDRDVRLSATSAERMAFKVVVSSSTPVFLRWQDRTSAGVRAWGNGIYLAGSGGSYEMSRDDHYIGAFSCFATASSTVTVVEF